MISCVSTQTQQRRLLSDVTCPPLYLWNCVIRSPSRRSLSLSRSLFYRSVGVSQQGRCSTYELDSESAKSDYREGKLDSDVKGFKTPTGQRRMCCWRALTASSSRWRKRRRRAATRATSSRRFLSGESMIPHALLCDWTGRHLRREHGLLFTGEAKNSARLFDNLSTLSGCGCLWETCLKRLFMPAPHPPVYVDKQVVERLAVARAAICLIKCVWRALSVSTNPPLAVADTRWGEGPRSGSFLHPETLWERPGEGDHPPRTHHGPVNKHRHQHQQQTL